MQGETRRLTVPNGDISLEALLHLPPGPSPEGLVVICHPHPQYGGSMDNNVVDAIACAVVQEGMAALRFNFRGVGRSTGSYDGGSGERTDVTAVLALARSLPGVPRIGLAGYSFGAWMAILAACGAGDIPYALAIVSPPMNLVGVAELHPCAMPCLLLAGDLDPICPAASLEAVVARGRPSLRHRIVEGADHSWAGYESELGDTVSSFFRWSLPAGR